ncbi:hypothetical protein ACFFX0_32235 [Citricoccus parietis]|uniref:Uncharacterized protein n=1 Tax=Citricoccus parietis TaxID=592307 RepID=A0ABV5GAU9_9MICC
MGGQLCGVGGDEAQQGLAGAAAWVSDRADLVGVARSFVVGEVDGGAPIGPDGSAPGGPIGGNPRILAGARLIGRTGKFFVGGVVGGIPGSLDRGV